MVIAHDVVVKQRKTVRFNAEAIRDVAEAWFAQLACDLREEMTGTDEENRKRYANEMWVGWVTILEGLRKSGQVPFELFTLDEERGESWEVTQEDLSQEGREGMTPEELSQLLDLPVHHPSYEEMMAG